MKQILLAIFLTIAFSSFELNAQSVTEEQRTLLVKKTADWCPHCGNWGWGFMKDIISDNENSAVAIGMHFSGGLLNNDARTVVNDFGGSGQPRFYVNGVDQNVSSSNTSTKRTEVQDLVDANFALDPDVNCGMNAELANGMIEVTAKAKFFQNVSGEYYMAMYIVEDSVFWNQTPLGTTHHPMIMRGSMSDVYGDLVINGSASAGDEFILDYIIPVDADWNTDRIRIAGVIWKKVGSDYEFVNTYSVDEFGVSTSVDFVEVEQMELSPNIGAHNSQLTILSTASIENATIELVNMAGQSLHTIHQGILSEGETTFQIELSKYPAGSYFVRLSDGKRIQSKKLIIQ